MVVADASLFRSCQNLHQQAAHGVMVAMMASDEKVACAANPRVLGPEGEGGVEQFPLRGTSSRSSAWGAA